MNSFLLKFQSSSWLTHPLVMSCATLLLLLLFLTGGWQRELAQDSPVAISAEEVDASLQRAATLALGGREGTVIVMEAQTGRVRALAGTRLADEEAQAPGSTIKPFAALAALRAGLLSADTRLLCRERYRRGDFEMKCSHPKEQPPFSPVEALAYSCNYFFGELGERLSADAFNRTLSSFGFGAQTGFSSTEVSGKLPRGSRPPSNTLGEGQDLLVTPVQLVTAYAALVNGGHLYAPQQSAPADFKLKERARIDIPSEHRDLLLKGMRGAVEYGTAAEAGLASLNVFGKTGTSTENDSARTQGWFIGFASDEGVNELAEPEEVKLVVLVFFKHAHGADCAKASRVVFEEFARLGSRGDKEARGRSDDEQVAAPARLNHGDLPVRVHQVRENVTRTMSLEDYVLGVVATEGSIEAEPAALKALAVAVRTYALKNLHRHASDGYDFCTTTHCQRYVPVNREEVRSDILSAVTETAGEVLRDGDNQLIESYFGASCGGMTADIHTLWGVAPKSYLRGTRDEYCADGPHSSWTDIIPAEKLAGALKGDERSNVGARVDEVRVLKKDATGRAELIELVGERRRTLRGWDFKIIVGRALGWNLLKSSRFEVRREGDAFVFRGSGFGHGLGLCQEGAHVMASSGADYRRILARYFPGTSLRKEKPVSS
ncbi:MAG: SpoIID/LytB domain-containing protein [Acidobacteria bacterium]|nr:SpoIID/LytB domain-containing protein [Acidobacteriota bacterium]